MSWLSSFLHPERGYDAAQAQLDKYFNNAQGHLQPYNQNGQDAYTGYKGAMDKLLNPTGLQDEWSKNYKESDIAKQDEAMATQHGLNAAQQMGLGGSSPALQAIQSGTAGIVAKDRQQYLDDLMKKYMTGIGIGSDIYGQGANAAGKQSENEMNMGTNSAGLQFGKTNSSGDMFGKIGGGAMKLLMDYLTGGMGTGGFGRGALS
jgi:hypothetical protein